MEGRNVKVGYTIRIIAGAYVVYLAFKIIRGSVIGESSISLPLSIAMGGILGLFGLAFVINGLLGYKKLKELEQEEAEAEEPEEIAQTEAAKKIEEKPVASSSSIMSRASMPDHLRVSDEDEE